MKWALRIVLVLVVLLVIAAGAAYFWMDSIAKEAVERAGTYATGVETEVNGVSLGLFSGEAGLNGLVIDNPEGFQSDNFLRLGEADLAVGLGSLREEVVRVPRVHLDDLVVNLERRGGRQNYQVILDNLERLSAGDPTPPGEEAQQWVVEDLRLRNVQVNASGEGLAGEQAVAFTIPEIQLENVRSDSLAELQGQILKQVFGVIVRQGAQQLPGVMLAELEGGLADIGELGEATLGRVAEITDVVGDVGRQVGEALEGVSPEAGRAVEEAARRGQEAVGEVTREIGGLLGGSRDGDDEEPPAPAE